MAENKSRPPVAGLPCLVEGGISDRERGEVIFEFVAVDNMVKVNVIHVATGLEVSTVGPADAARHDLERLGLAKLNYLLRKQPESGRAASQPPRRGSKKGFIV